jgi:tetratricopeptide (TPR) repeat protein
MNLIQNALFLHKSGNFDAAIQIYEQLSKQSKNNPSILSLLGVAECQRGNQKTGIKYLEKSLKISPVQPEVHNDLGNAYKAVGRLGDAISSYKRAVALNPDFALAYNNLGNAFQEHRQYDEALNCFDLALKIDPVFADAHFNRGNALQDLRRFADAVVAYDKSIQIYPGFIQSLNNRGNALLQLNRLEDALLSLESAIELAPSHFEAINNKGNVLQKQGRYHDAVSCYEQALAINPNYVLAISNIGNAYKCLGDFENSIRYYNKALEIDSRFAEANFNKSLLLLLLADFDAGLPMYEWRWKRKNAESIKYPKVPLWQGEDISKKSIYVYPEQGFGDFIQYVRYIFDLKNIAGKVILEVPEALYELLLPIFGLGCTLIKPGLDTPRFDYRCPIMSLPLAFKTDLNSIPGPVSYLSVSQEKSAEWLVKLGEKTRPRIGLIWSGNPAHQLDQQRSIPLSVFAPILDMPFEFYALQKDIRSDDAETLLRYSNLKDFSSELEDFTDTAALVLAMDLVVAVDTSVAHLAGALGKRFFLLLPTVPDSRWLLNLDHSPWYPSAELLRQEKLGEWDFVIRQLHTKLASIFSV